MSTLRTRTRSWPSSSAIVTTSPGSMSSASREAPLVMHALDPGREARRAISLASPALSTRQIEGRLVLRLHGRRRAHDALDGLHADIVVALDVVVADGEARRQVDVLGTRLPEQLGHGAARVADVGQLVLADHPDRGAAALGELQLAIALDAIEVVGDREQLEAAADAHLARQAEAAHGVGELRDVEVVLARGRRAGTSRSPPRSAARCPGGAAGPRLVDAVAVAFTSIWMLAS